MKQYLIATLILFAANGLWAQKPDDSRELTAEEKAEMEVKRLALRLAAQAQAKIRVGDEQYRVQFDSLNNLAAAYPELSLVKALFSLTKGMIGMGSGELNEAIILFKEAESKFNLLGSHDTILVDRSEMVAKCLSNMSICYTHLNKADSAEWCLQQVISEMEKAGDKYVLSSGYMNLAMSKQNRGQFDQAIDLYHKSLSLKEEIKDTVGIIIAYQNMSGVYNEWGERKTAFDYYLRSISLAESIGDSLSIMYGEMGIVGIALTASQNTQLIRESRTNLATDTLYSGDIPYDGINNEKDDQKDAVRRLLRAYVYFEKKRRPREIALIEGKLGDLYALLGESDSSKMYYDRFFQRTKGSQYGSNQLFALRKWAELLMKDGQYEEAKQALEQAKVLANTSGQHYLEVPILRLLSACHEATGDFETALMLRKQFDLTKDSIYTFQNSERRRQLTAEYEAKYETEKLRADNAIQEQRAAQMTYLTGGVSVFAIMALGFVVYYRRTSQQMSRQKQLIQDLSREHHHSSGNLLENLRHGQAKVFSAATDLKKAKQEIDQLTEAHFEVFRDMSEVYAEMDGKVALNDRLAKVARSLVKIRQYEADQQVALDLDLDDIQTDPDKVHALTQITREAITNAFKHGFDRAKSAELAIGLEEQGRQALLTIKDNGSGLSQQHDHSGKGLKHMEELAKDINAKLTVLNGEGTTIKIAFAV